MSITEAKVNKTNSTSFFSLILKSVIAAVIAGASLAVLNFFIEYVKGNPFFRLNEIYSLILWHAVVYLIIGGLLGLIYSFYFLISRNVLFKNHISLIYLYVFCSCWMLIAGYLNVDLFPSFFSISSVIGNLFLLGVGASLFIIILKRTNTSKIRKFPVILKFLIPFIIIISAFSFIHDRNFFSKKGKGPILEAKDKSNYFNVIMISLDAVRSDHLGCYGYERKTSPTIDRMAAEGVLFENAFANSSHTRESVPSIFSSTYPSTHNIIYDMKKIPKELIMFPSLFKFNGYRTAFFTTLVVLSSIYGYDRDIDDFYEPHKNINAIQRTILAHYASLKIPLIGYLNSQILEFTYSFFRTKYSLESNEPDYAIQNVISWIEVNRKKPFFLYLHLRGGHTPYDPPEEYKRLFDPDFPEKPLRNPPPFSFSMFPFIKETPLSNPELKNLIAQYDAKIFYHDKHLRTLLDYLEKTKLTENTIVILTADHGEEFYDHFGWAHGYSVFDELIHIPLIIYCPGLITKGKRIKELISHVDIFPTICSLCGIYDSFKFPYEIEGIDLSSLILTINNEKKREYIFSETNQMTRNQSARCLRTNEDKAIKITSGQKSEHLFFDLISDPLEQNNIYDEENPTMVNLFSRLDAIVKKAKKKAFSPKQILLDKKTKEQLRALGYIK